MPATSVGAARARLYWILRNPLAKSSPLMTSWRSRSSGEKQVLVGHLHRRSKSLRLLQHRHRKRGKQNTQRQLVSMVLLAGEHVSPPPRGEERGVAPRGSDWEGAWFDEICHQARHSHQH